MQRKPSPFMGLVLGIVVATTTFAPAQGLINSSGSHTAKATPDTSSCTGELCFTSFGHNYGSVAENSSTQYGVQLTNGTSSAFPFSVSVTGNSHYTQANNCGASLAAGAYCEILFIYTAGSTPETDTATISVPANGFTFNTGNTGTLTGQTVGTTAGAIVVNTNEHSFGGLPFGTTAAFGWSITNETSASQTISFTPSGDTTDFTLATNCPASLGSGKNCEVVFTYLPNSTSTQTFTDTINTSANVYINGTTTSAKVLTLLGNGTGTLAANKAIQHVVIIYPENISFDHYFGTYPNAANTDGQTFTPIANSPVPNNYTSNPTLLTENPNYLNSANGTTRYNPFRLSYSQASTADQSHSYTPEEEAYDNGAMDLFPKLRRQHGHRAVELRAELRDERQQLRHRLRAVHARRAQPGWFQYYASTINPTHARPSSTSAIGTTDAANHQYDLQDLYTALSNGVLPTVSFVKPQGYEEGHAGYSDPIDEQTLEINVINALQQSSYWGNTAVIIAYDDSDGWYDHQYLAPVNGSFTVEDELTGTHACGVSGTTPILPGVNGDADAQGRCGYGPRLPLLVISSWAKANYIDHTLTDQTSILRFIEDTYLSGERIGSGSFDAQAGPLYNMFDFAHSTAPNATEYVLSPTTGQPTTPAEKR
jgi:phospholipase C